MSANVFVRVFVAAGLAVTTLCSLASVAPAVAAPDMPIPEQAVVPELHALLPEKIRSAGVLNLATDAHYPPCQWFLEDGKTMIGYEVDIWNALAQVLGVKLEAVSIDFAGLIPGVAGGRYDLAMECITDRTDREEQVTFVNHSLDYGNAFYYLTSTATITAGDALSLCGHKTAGQSGTDFVDKLEALAKWCVDQGKETIEVGQYPTASGVLLALFSGRIDFALSEASAVEELKANNPVDVGTISNPLEVQNYLGIVTAKDNEPLQQALLGALKAIKANGTYDMIFEKWSLPHAALDEFGINMTTTKPRG
ncbi:ABC transporter substrate-binding protein [Methylobrevis pamukkalensis]|uniref:Glutamine-binding periplasmic protein n=1 Tax=Methylobrevis pamukkalensis TaxID=1439726 RepID=A0A1E3H5I7_9HYPH|nr:ABC transporter substrate-binding protein [Methylobrevis pamukkalensis]ODN71066.1 Glutamine-binding periplasmic protein precursor [Methylobrevis pamukkalensis]